MSSAKELASDKPPENVIVSGMTSERKEQVDSMEAGHGETVKVENEKPPELTLNLRIKQFLIDEIQKTLGIRQNLQVAKKRNEECVRQMEEVLGSKVDVDTRARFNP